MSSLTKPQLRRLIKLYRDGVPPKRLAAEVGKTELGVMRILRNRLGVKLQTTLTEKMIPFVEKNATVSEVQKRFPTHTRKRISVAMARARKKLGLPDARCQSGAALRLPLLIHARLSEEAKARGFNSSTALAVSILEAAIADGMIDAILDTDEARAA
jgi:hypothetical protein